MQLYEGKKELHNCPPSGGVAEHLRPSRSKNGKCSNRREIVKKRKGGTRKKVNKRHRPPGGRTTRCGEGVKKKNQKTNKGKHKAPRAKGVGNRGTTPAGSEKGREVRKGNSRKTGNTTETPEIRGGRVTNSLTRQKQGVKN